jgi:MFS family permease
MILVCFGGSIPFILLLANIHQGVSPYVLLLALTGAGFFANMVWGPALSMPADMFPAEVYGKAMGFTNCIGYMLASACPYIMGALIVRDPATGSVDYHRAWLYVAFAAFAGVVAALFLVDRKRSEGGAAVSKPVLDSLTAQPNP